MMAPTQYVGGSNSGGCTCGDEGDGCPDHRHQPAAKAVEGWHQARDRAPRRVGGHDGYLAQCTTRSLWRNSAASAGIAAFFSVALAVFQVAATAQAQAVAQPEHYMDFVGSYSDQYLGSLDFSWPATPTYAMSWFQRLSPDTDNTLHCMIDWGNNKAYACYRIGTQQLLTVGNSFAGSWTIETSLTGDFQHIVFNVENYQIQIYVDGVEAEVTTPVQAAQTALSQAAAGASACFVLGAEMDGPECRPSNMEAHQALSGHLARVSVFERLLNSTEVAALSAGTVDICSLSTHATYDQFKALNCPSVGGKATIKYLFDECGDQPALQSDTTSTHLIDQLAQGCPGGAAPAQVPTGTYVDLSGSAIGGTALAVRQYRWPVGGQWGVSMWVRFKESSSGAVLLSWGGGQVSLVVDHVDDAIKWGGHSSPALTDHGLEVNVWQHVTVAVDASSRVLIYIDAGLVDVINNPNPVPPRSGTGCLVLGHDDDGVCGSDAASSRDVLRADVAQIVLWSLAPTAEEVESLVYNSSSSWDVCGLSSASAFYDDEFMANNSQVTSWFDKCGTTRAFFAPMVCTTGWPSVANDTGNEDAPVLVGGNVWRASVCEPYPTVSVPDTVGSCTSLLVPVATVDTDVQASDLVVRLTGVDVPVMLRHRDHSPTSRFHDLSLRRAVEPGSYSFDLKMSWNESFNTVVTGFELTVNCAGMEGLATGQGQDFVDLVVTFMGMQSGDFVSASTGSATTVASTLESRLAACLGVVADGVQVLSETAHADGVQVHLSVLLPWVARAPMDVGLNKSVVVSVDANGAGSPRRQRAVFESVGRLVSRATNVCCTATMSRAHSWR